ncbi:hypothetical protein VDG1235_230 [Verrucomicrobiia bacterium DG1235]|nr:hypothetical protein VDG1235_230 [Verrucomicrobiae bacterium DG1235]
MSFGYRFRYKTAKILYRLLTDRDLHVDLWNFKHIERAQTKAFQNEARLECLGWMNKIVHSNVKPAAMPRRPDGWMHEEIFLLGSGASLAKLTPAERKVIRESASIALNKYLIYWDEIGIWPTYTALSDIHFPTSRVMAEKLKVVSQNLDKPIPRFVLTEEYQTWGLEGIEPMYFKRPHGEGDHPWAQAPDEPMFYHRGSLTCILNFLTVHRIAPKVTMIGVDLNSASSFYDQRYQQDTHLHDMWESFKKKNNIHPTAAEVNSVPPVQAILPMVFDKMRELGIEPSCYNDDSLLITDSLCPLRERLT